MNGQQSLRRASLVTRCGEKLNTGLLNRGAGSRSPCGAARSAQDVRIRRITNVTIHILSLSKEKDPIAIFGPNRDLSSTEFSFHIDFCFDSNPNSPLNPKTISLKSLFSRPHLGSTLDPADSSDPGSGANSDIHFTRLEYDTCSVFRRFLLSEYKNI
ncbi:hypothetical protein EVAR_89800_1 [Eumeta japonica]|uniref:Uncharacterized protein n=1 Tax=Eumeta variegata TaxID=151549 RepID=A0A4C1ZZM3_EUMVA|nr:hypothetical protein EVAR_89800_1 [Eumeta japonica]